MHTGKRESPEIIVSGEFRGAFSGVRQGVKASPEAFGKSGGTLELINDRTLQPQRYFRRADAAHYVRSTWGIPCSTKWLAKLAVVGGGPIFRKAGRFPIYQPTDLDQWAEARIGAPRRSTSEAM